MTPIHHFLIITAIGTSQPHLINEITRACTQNGGNLLQAKITSLGGDLSCSILVSGNWGVIAKIETALPNLERRLGLRILAKRTTENHPSGKLMTYSIQITAIDKAGILQGVSEFLLAHSIPIEEVNGHTYLTHTGTRMLSLGLKIFISDKIHLASFREQFINYCDDHNLDMFLEPVRS